MIRAVRLANWKRYESFDYVFEPGVTFVLGTNGRGKSSLLQAMRLALVGSLRDLAPKDGLRVIGSPGSTSVELDGDPSLTFSCTVDKRGSTSHRVVGTTATPADALRERFGADPAFLDGLMFLGEGEIYTAASTSRDIAAQVAELLGTEGFARLLEQIRAAKAPLAKRQRVQRKELDTAREEAVLLEQQADELSESIARLADQEAELLEKYSHLRAASALRERWITLQASAAEWEVRFRAFATVLLPDTIRRDQTPEAVVAALQDVESRTEREVRELAAEHGGVTGKIELVGSFVAALEDASTVQCPLCRQELDAGHRSRALESHRMELGALRSREAAAKEALDLSTARLSETRTLAETALELLASRPDGAAASDEPPEDAIAQAGAAEAELSKLRSRRRTAEEELVSVRGRLAASNAEQAAARDVVAAFREEALLSIAEQTIREFLDDVALSVLEPLEQHLAAAWKSYRPDAELSLSLDEAGSPCLVRGERLLPYAALSGGEKMVANVLLRVALSTSLTRSDVLVLDEPLEHLDPRGRRLMISSLYGAVQKGILRQVIISTYEESLVRRLLSRSDVHALWLP